MTFEENLLGYVLSGSTTKKALFQPIETAESIIREGMLVVIKEENPILAVISEISRHHEFYEAGDVWSEAIRKGLRPPEKVARKYTIAYLRLMGKILGNALYSPDKPPKPGSVVMKMDLSLIHI